MKMIPSAELRIPLLPPGPEADLLRYTALWPNAQKEVTAEMIDTVDRQLLIKLAHEHRLLPSLFGAVASSSLADTWPKLHYNQQRQSLRALHQAAITLQFLDLFEKAGCRALVLKGQALSTQLYGRADMRMSSDIDFLIDPSMMAKAHNIIVENGYAPLYPVDVENLSFVNKDQVYISETTKIELHWRLFDNQAFLPWSFEDLWASRVCVKLMQSKEVPTLARDRHFFYQGLHGLRHGWRRFRWVVDLAIPLQNERDAESLFSLAKEHNFVPAILHMLSLSQNFLSITPGSQIIANKKQYVSANRIDNQIKVLSIIRNSNNNNKFNLWFRQRLSEKYLDLILCPSLKSRLIEIKQYFIGIGDLIDARLPKKLLWMYIFIRPFLFMRRAFLRYRKRDSG